MWLRVLIWSSIQSSQSFAMNHICTVCIVCVQFMYMLYLQVKERGFTRVHSLNNVNRVLEILQKNNVSYRQNGSIYSSIYSIFIVLYSLWSNSRRCFDNYWKVKIEHPLDGILKEWELLNETFTWKRTIHFLKFGLERIYEKTWIYTFHVDL